MKGRPDFALDHLLVLVSICYCYHRARIEYCYTMSDGSELLLAKLDSLNDSLDDLEERLEPLLAQTLPESLLPLDTIQQVKLNVALPYLVYDLIFSL